MEEVFIKNIENTLDSLDKTSLWIFFSIIVTLISTSAKDPKIKIGDFEVDRKYSGLAIYLILCGLNFYTLKLLNNFYSQYFELQNFEFKDFKDATDTMGTFYSLVRGHNWLFNPFSETLNSGILDNLGIALNIILWWLGYSLAVRETTRNLSNDKSSLEKDKTRQEKIKIYFYNVSILILSIIFLVLGNNSLKLITILSENICNDFNSKKIYANLGIIIGMGIFLIVNRFFFMDKYHIFLKFVKSK